MTRVNERDRQRLHGIAKDLNIPRGRWMLNGSGVMVLHGIDRTMRDVDVFCATQTWFSLFKSGGWDIFCTDPDDPKRRCDPPYLYRVMYGIEVNIFFSWRRRGIADYDTAFLLHNTVEVDGIPCVPLQYVLDWKREMGRSKDVDDIRLIEEHMGKKAV